MTHRKRKGLSLLLAFLLAIPILFLPQGQADVSAASITGNFEWQYVEELGGVEIRNYRGTDEVISIPSQLGGYPVKSIGTSAFSGSSFLQTLILPDTVTTVKDYAFRNCPILGSITFSASLTSIGASAFENAGMVTSLSLPASLKSIGGYAFSGCTSLREVSFPTALESIGGYAFMGANLRSVALPDSLKSMSDKAFYNSGVEEIHASTNSLGHQYAELNGIRFVSTGSSVTPPSEPTEENGVKLAIPSLSMQVGTYYDCLVTAPLTGDLQIFASNDCVAVVDGGKLTVETNGRSFRLYAQKAGPCTIIVRSATGSATLPVTVTAASGGSTNPPQGSGWVSDTTADLTVQQGKTYQFKFTASDPDQLNMWMGTSGVFQVKKASVEPGKAVYYKITAVGAPGAQAGVYVSYQGGSGTKLCVATVGGQAASSGSFVCDTTADFGVAQGASYQFKITATGGKKPTLWAGTSGVFRTEYVKQEGNDYFYRITAVGNPGQEAGIYVALEGEPGVKQCVAAIAYG